MLALDELDIYGLRRCTTCGGKLIRATEQTTLRKHIGHRLTQPMDVHFWEWVRIKAGLL